MPGFIGVPEIILLLVVALLVFGPKKLPEMGRSLGKGMREFKDSVSGSDRDESPKDELRVLDATEAPARETSEARAEPLPTADGATRVR